jgi:hypothetical protein
MSTSHPAEENPEGGAGMGYEQKEMSQVPQRSPFSFPSRLIYRSYY